MGEPGDCVSTVLELNEYNASCIAGARNAIGGCVGNLFGAIGAVAGAKGGLLVSWMAAQAARLIGDILGGYMADAIPDELIKNAFCRQPDIEPCCGKKK